jgi:hypothetical protein
LEINKYGDKKLNQIIKPNNNIYHRTNDGYVKLNIMNLAQQNLYMLKRLTEKKSEYSVKKMEEDYKKVQNYKKIMCNFPCINFNKTKRGLSSDSKYRQSERNEFLPTINYINDGYLDKLGQKIKSGKSKDKNKEVKITGKKLFNNNMSEKNDKKISDLEIKDKDKNKDKNEHKLNGDESDNEKIIDVSRNENEINKDDNLEKI